MRKIALVLAAVIALSSLSACKNPMEELDKINDVTHSSS